MSNMGRPKLDEPMVHKVSVRFNEREYQRLKAYAESINKTMTEALKDGIELLYKNSQEKEQVQISFLSYQKGDYNGSKKRQ